MPINLQTFDSHRFYPTFLDALQAGMNADDIADIVSDALNQAKTSYEATLRQAQQKEKEAAVDSLLSAIRVCGTAFEIPALAAEDSATTKDEFINFMEAMRDIFNLAPSADKGNITLDDNTSILKKFAKTLL